MPGFSRVPSCTISAAPSMPPVSISEIGMLQLATVPVKSPSLS